ncbi:MAG: protein YgfX [Gammaproteobacteria bacterium]|nr:protein YgfX [Gammaproteobacteria bacterium]
MYQCALLVLSCSIIITLPCAMLWKGLLMMFLIGYLLRAFYLQQQWQQLTYHNKQWRVSVQAREWDCQLCGDSMLTDCVLVLRFIMSETHRKKTWAIFRDSVTAEEYRRLRALARMGLE